MKNAKRFLVILLAMAMLINPINVEAKAKSNATIKNIKVNSDNSFRIKIKAKKSKKIKGYQIRYSLKKNMKEAVKVTTDKKNVTVKKLKASRLYYVQVRTFEMVNGKKVYSKWSPKEKARTKSKIKVNKLTIKLEDGSEIVLDGDGNVVNKENKK